MLRVAGVAAGRLAMLAVSELTAARHHHRPSVYWPRPARCHTTSWLAPLACGRGGALISRARFRTEIVFVEWKANKRPATGD